MEESREHHLFSYRDNDYLRMPQRAIDLFIVGDMPGDKFKLLSMILFLPQNQITDKYLNERIGRTIRGKFTRQLVDEGYITVESKGNDTFHHANCISEWDIYADYDFTELRETKKKEDSQTNLLELKLI